MLQQEIERILEEYDKSCSSAEIRHLIQRWQSAKDTLRTILSSHSSWHDEQHCIVLPYREFRSNDDRYEKFRKLIGYIKTQFYVPDEIQKVFNEFACSEMDKFLGADTVSCISNISASFSFKEGQKLSRAVNKVCSFLDADTLPDYNRLFAEFADSVNPLEIERTGVLSVNPIDYLLMSNGDGWKSCHNIADGCYCAGTLSYLCDPSSMVFYTVSEESENLSEVPKITRNIFAYANGKLLQSRCYPSNQESVKQNYRNIVQSIIADCLGLPNIWRLEKDFDIVSSHLETDPDSKHYPDYEFSIYKPNISILKDFPDIGGKIHIGSVCCCIKCGSELSDSDSLLCNDCCDEYICNSCGCQINRDDIIWIDGESYCSECVYYCDRCGEFYVQETTAAAGPYDRVCDNCLDTHYRWCEDCETYYPLDCVVWIECDEKYVCENCVVNYFYCDECNEYHPLSDIHETDDGCFCGDCFSAIAEKEAS